MAPAEGGMGAERFLALFAAPVVGRRTALACKPALRFTGLPGKLRRTDQHKLPQSSSFKQPHAATHRPPPFNFTVLLV